MRHQKNECLILLIVLTYLTSSLVHGQLLEGLYCGKENCYTLLGVSRDSTKNDIAKNYRKLARQFHPDLHRDKEAKQIAEEKFKEIANAYEILKDDDSRSDYDYMLDNPDEFYAHYYRYYRRRVAPKVDVRIVLIVTITIISVVQYYSSWQRYNTAIKYFVSVPKYRNRAMDIAKEEGLLNLLANDKKRRSKSELKEAQDKIIQQIIENKMDIKGAYAKPTLYDILWIQLILCPYTLVKYIIWYVSWIWNHDILRKPYETEEKLFLIRKLMKMGQHQFDQLEDEKKEEFLRRELWIKSNFSIWKHEEEENMKKQLAENTKYKQYRRYVKNHGVGRMTFDDS
ncbi:dnaJ homolog subfamily C member 25 homolog [Onthophagus taurus]|uniref:dnaJ homolog subfamily C member 25 homolog n=1 Tax=Onthophagus taurus TaxID=166361 RepID=UPI000C203EFB|nr:dnaJ homolog subfamily C member 25 homolog isoform X1 [Onthophagus taurus]